MIGPSVQVPLNGTTHTLPVRKALRWGTNVTGFFEDLSDVLDGTFQAIIVTTGATTIDFVAGKNVSLQLNASTILTFQNPRQGRPSTFFIYQGGAFDITWPSNVRWMRGGAGNTPLIITPTVGQFDIVTMIYDPTKLIFGASYDQDGKGT
jgi:hypothetical protein